MQQQTEVPRLADLPDGLKVGEAAAVLRLGLSAMYEAIRRGDIYAVQIGRRLTVPKTEIARMLRVDLKPAPFTAPGTNRQLRAKPKNRVAGARVSRRSG